jgi:hypothetical protein
VAADELGAGSLIVAGPLLADAVACATLPAGEPADRPRRLLDRASRVWRLDGGVEKPIVWMACDCGATMARRVNEDDHAGRVARRT